MVMPYATLLDELRNLVDEENFTVIFTKKDQTERTMLCHLTDGAAQLHNGRMTVFDVMADGLRYVNFNTLKVLRFKGKSYQIKEGKWTLVTK